MKECSTNFEESVEAIKGHGVALSLLLPLRIRACSGSVFDPVRLLLTQDLD